MRPFRCPVTILNTLDHLGTKACDDAGKMESVPGKDYILLPLWPADPLLSQSPKSSPDDGFKPLGDDEKKVTEEPGKEGGDPSNKNDSVNSTNNINTASDGNITNNVNTISLTVNIAGIKVNAASSNTSIELPNDLNMPELEDIVYLDDYEDVGAEANMSNLNTFMHVCPIPTTRIHKDHLVEQISGDLNLAPQTRRMTKMTKNLKEHGLFSSVQQRTNQKDFQNCLFACFLSQEEPKKTLVDLPNDKRAIGTKCVFRNKKDERGIMIKNKARLVTQGYTQQEGIDYDEVFSPVARIEVIRLFLAYASFKDFVAYQMDVKSTFPYGKIEEEVYVYQPPGFEDPDFPDRVYRIEKALYGLHQAPRAWYETLSTYLLDNGFQRGKIDKTLFIRRNKGDILLVQVYVDHIIFGSIKKLLCTEFKKMMHKKFQISYMGELTFFLGLQVKQKEDGIFISQDKYVTEILKKFSFTDVRTASTPIVTQMPLLKDEDDSPFDLVAYTDADYARVSLDRKSTTGDLLTKAFDVSRFQYLIASIGMLNLQSLDYGKCMVKNLDNAGKFLMYPRFVQVFLDQQVGEMSTHNKIYVTPSHTKKIFANMRRQGKDFSGRITPLFPTMVVQAQEEMGEDKAVNEEPSMQLKELMDLYTKLQQRVFDLENIKTAQAQEITSLKLRVKKLEKKGGSETHKLKRLYKVSRSARVVSSNEASLGDQEDASKQGRKIDNIDADAGIILDSTHFDVDTDMLRVHDLDGDEVVVESEVATKKKDDKVNVVKEVVSDAEETVNAATITEDEITLAQALAELKSVKPKVTVIPR
ncbi:putative ribonuclease H-like domain-containing protein [Tanacetum coccineum]